jgi:hypothetical protein
LRAGFFAEAGRTGLVVAECEGRITAVACVGAPVDVVDGCVTAAPVAVEVAWVTVFVAVATTGAVAADVVAAVSLTVFVTACVTGAVADETGAGALGACEVADVAVVTAFVTGVVAVVAGAAAAEVSAGGDAVGSASAQAGPEKAPATTSAATNGRKRDARRAFGAAAFIKRAVPARLLLVTHRRQKGRTLREKTRARRPTNLGSRLSGGGQLLASERSWNCGV